MSDDPLKDIQAAEEAKQATVAKREEKKMEKIHTLTLELQQALQKKKDKKTEELKAELLETRSKESEELKSKLRKEQENVVQFTADVKKTGKAEKAVQLIVDVFLNKK